MRRRFYHLCNIHTNGPLSFRSTKPSAEAMTQIPEKTDGWLRLNTGTRSQTNWRSIFSAVPVRSFGTLRDVSYRSTLALSNTSKKSSAHAMPSTSCGVSLPAAIPVQQQALAWPSASQLCPRPWLSHCVLNVPWKFSSGWNLDVGTPQILFYQTKARTKKSLSDRSRPKQPESSMMHVCGKQSVPLKTQPEHARKLRTSQHPKAYC